jgi:tetratricopeptide (TPR) repeat protein
VNAPPHASVPGPARAALDRGLSLLRQGRVDAALAALEGAAGLAPNWAEAHAQLGAARMVRGHFQAALAALRKAAELAPGDAPILNQLGAALLNVGELDEAAAAYARVLEADPDNEDAVLGRAAVLERQGAFEAAFALLEPLLAAGSLRFEVAYVLGGLARHLGREAEAVDWIERALAGPDDPLRPDQRRVLHVRAGNLLDRMGEYDRAFDHFRRANALGTGPFDLEGHRKETDRIVAAYDRETLAALPRSSVDSELPVFILGMPRSGTSLTEQILASHPAVFGAGELPDLRDIAHLAAATTGKRLPYPECVRLLSQGGMNALAQRYLTGLRRKAPDALRITDKMPHNFELLGLIALLFPKARVLHCVRDPMDNCLSCYTVGYTGVHGYANDLATLGRYYRAYRRLMAHWQAVLDVPIMTVRYEDMVADTEAMSRAIVDFVGLPWDDACLRFHESRRAVTTASYDQVRRPVYTRSVERWRHYERHLGPLREALEGE